MAAGRSALCLRLTLISATRHQGFADKLSEATGRRQGCSRQVAVARRASPASLQQCAPCQAIVLVRLGELAGVCSTSGRLPASSSGEPERRVPARHPIVSSALQQLWYAFKSTAAPHRVAVRSSVTLAVSLSSAGLVQSRGSLCSCMRAAARLQHAEPSSGQELRTGWRALSVLYCAQHHSSIPGIKVSGCWLGCPPKLGSLHTQAVVRL